MDGILPRYIFVVTIFLWIPLSNGCMNTAVGEFMNCTMKLNIPMAASPDKSSLKQQMDVICKMESEKKKKFHSCFDNFKKCEQIKTISESVGINILKTMESTEKLCKHEQVILDGMPCLMGKIMEIIGNSSTDTLEKFKQLYSKGSSLFIDMMNQKMTRDEYDRKYCPILKEGIEDLSLFKCEEKFNKVVKDYAYDIMSDKCRSINKIDSSGIKSLPNISLISLLFLILLFVIS
ncbi:uncharacterized protein LOC106869697 [Octopus bimaculoides]|uniref:Uncharacterized protein n=1 Tax=Octopus bimaculoides TaxID=37653 RepID=A0A0L8HMU2_OCTBM|nr:uncharacterized protein LOC106869697 [Octopus bimaculoides]|eukprot:XP_014771024.1 PREDICTED: uncharacterized protein LOC106869697 [Octopus bimaculoides]